MQTQNNVTVHRYSRTERPISVNGVSWGMARLNETLGSWIIKANDPKIVVPAVAQIRHIEFAVLNVLKGC